MEEESTNDIMEETEKEEEKGEILIYGTPIKVFINRAIFYAVVLAVLVIVMFLLYAVVYERCYNIMNADELIVFRLCKSETDGRLYAVFFNKLYKIF